MLEDLLNDHGTGAAEDRSIERMWPLDFALSLLGILVFYTVATRLDPQDPRVLYNPLTYAFAVPVGIVGISILLRFVATRFIRRSMQLGFLISVLMHLLLLIWAVNKMILTPLLATPSSGAELAPTPARKTVPDYLFSQARPSEEKPDWARPVDAETASRDPAPETRQLPPLENSPTELSYAKESPELQSPDLDAQIERSTPEFSQPSPANTTLPLARQESVLRPQTMETISVPDLPQVDSPAPQSSPAKDLPVDRSRVATSQDLRDSLVRPPTAPEALNPVVDRTVDPSPSSVPRSSASDRALPRVELTQLPQTPSRIQRRETADPVGVAAIVPTMRTTPPTSKSSDQVAERNIASLAPSRTMSETRPSLASPDQNASSEAQQNLLDSGIVGESTMTPSLSRAAKLSQAGRPEISGLTSGTEPSLRRAPRSPASGSVSGVFSAPAVSAISNGTPTESMESGTGDTVGSAKALDRLAQLATREGRGTPPGRDSKQQTDGNQSALRLGNRPGETMVSPGPPTGASAIDLAVQVDPAGFATSPGLRPGASMAAAIPEINRIDLGIPAPPKRFLGGTSQPAGSDVSGVRPFDRRMMRTSGGAAPAPSGQIGPETEQAIELGLAYLAERQNADGSWSLQGHGEDVLIQSNTAATGLCLLAFQGAGYTHKAHQYAGTVERGLRFLISTQKSGGDLYRPEDAASNRNAWLYSHAIATLALCEAYGMTADPELRRPAERAIEFIATSQDPQQGGWRYQPRTSSDTSVTGWMMMALKSGELSGLAVSRQAYSGIKKWMDLSQASTEVPWEYSYNPFAPDTPTQRHGRKPSTTMTAVGLLARLYLGWERSKPEMQRGADVLIKELPSIGNPRNNLRDTYYWYYATQVMFHMGGDYWKAWNAELNPILTTSQVKSGPDTGSWDPLQPVPDRWAPHAGRIYVTTMNLLSLEVHYRHLPIYIETAK